jgi:hypothetical protein
LVREAPNKPRKFIAEINQEPATKLKVKSLRIAGKAMCTLPTCVAARMPAMMARSTKAELLQLRAHVVEVEPEFTRGESGADFGFSLLTLLRRLQDGGKLGSRHHDHPVVIGHDRVARFTDL